MYYKNILNKTAGFLRSDAFISLLILSAMLAFLLWLGGCTDAKAVCALIVPGIAGGKHIAGEPLTLSNSEEAAPGLLKSEIDERIVKIRPMATPIDQISRLGGARRCGSMEVEYFSVDTPRISTVTTEASTPSGIRPGNAPVSFLLKVEESAIFAVSETVMLPKVKTTDTHEPVILYITEVLADNSLRVIAINGEGESKTCPSIAKGSELVRMGRAAGELDVQTSQFQALPRHESNYCQIFKTQVEQSTYHNISNKVVGWSFSDQEEAAIIDMRQGMEKNFLFGSRWKYYDSAKGTDVWFTGGIWNQAGRDFVYQEGAFDNGKLIEMCRLAFTGQGASSKKILVGGSKLIEELTRLEHTKVIGALQTTTRWGLDFTEIVSKFGKLYVMVSETFDQCGRCGDGMIIDPEYITKYCHVPFSTKRLDLRSAGVRNTDAIVITESSCLVLRYPEAHMRITSTPKLVANS